MPSKKTRAGEQRQVSGSDVGDVQAMRSLDVKYNPDIITSLLADLDVHTKAKCQSIYKDADFLITSMQQAFHLELIKLPNQVKKMTMKQFREQFQCSVEAVTRNAMAAGPAAQSAASYKNKVMETPAMSRGKGAGNSHLVMQTPMNSNSNGNMRAPREGENILSVNGSPLGEFTTVKKPSKAGPTLNIPPPTPGVYLPNISHDVILDVENIDVTTLAEEQKKETLQQMSNMMANLQAMMNKLKTSST